jgi:hypothetical protein
MIHSNILSSLTKIKSHIVSRPSGTVSHRRPVAFRLLLSSRTKYSLARHSLDLQIPLDQPKGITIDGAEVIPHSTFINVVLDLVYVAGEDGCAREFDGLTAVVIDGSGGVHRGCVFPWEEDGGRAEAVVAAVCGGEIDGERAGVEDVAGYTEIGGIGRLLQFDVAYAETFDPRIVGCDARIRIVVGWETKCCGVEKREYNFELLIISVTRFTSHDLPIVMKFIATSSF